MAACSVLAGCKEMWKKVIPDWEEQSLDPEISNTENPKIDYSGGDAVSILEVRKMG